MSRFDFIRLRGTVIAISTFFAMVSLYVIIDQRPAGPGVVRHRHARPPHVRTRGDDDTHRQSTVRARATFAQRAAQRPAGRSRSRCRPSTPKRQPSPTATCGAISRRQRRFYKEVNDIAVKANWDVDRIVRNNDGARWKALLTGTPTGVVEARQAIRDRCRVNLPEPPSIEVDSTGQIRDPRLAKLLEQVDKELPESARASTTTRP